MSLKWYAITPIINYFCSYNITSTLISNDGNKLKKWQNHSRKCITIACRRLYTNFSLFSFSAFRKHNISFGNLII